MTMLIHPQIDPVAINLGLLKIHWYGLMYFFSFMLFLLIGKKRLQKSKFLNLQIFDDIFFYGALGVILGGRFGYILFYQPTFYFNNPEEILFVWKGGMSFHGGLIGVILSIFFVGKKHRIAWLKLTDFIAPFVPIGLGLGRLGNFINQELWGKPSSLPWSVVFPKIDNLSRHPSQFYEFFLEGVILFIILKFYSKRESPTGKVSGVFLIFYSLFRFIAEFFREPDSFLGFLFFHLTMGQILCIPMLIAGLILFFINSSD